MALYSHPQPITDISEAPDAHGTLEALYNATVVDHINHPRNLGVLADANGVATLDDEATENLIIMYLRVEQGHVQAASFRALACSACIAASSVVTELLRGIASEDRIHSEAVLEALGDLPESKRYCAALAAQCANAALEDATSRP